ARLHAEPAGTHSPAMDVIAFMSWFSCSDAASRFDRIRPPAAHQALGPRTRADSCAGIPGVDLDVEPGENTVALACPDLLSCAQALAGPDGCIGLDRHSCSDTPACFQMHAAPDGLA